MVKVQTLLEVFPGKKLMPWSGTPRLLRLEMSCRHCLKRRHEGLSNSSLQIIFIQVLRPTTTSKINNITGNGTRHSKKKISGLNTCDVPYFQAQLFAGSGLSGRARRYPPNSVGTTRDVASDLALYFQLWFCSFQSHIKYILMC